MKQLIFLALVSLATVTNAQQWTGSGDTNGLIERTGSIKASGLWFGNYGGSLVGDPNPYMISSPANGETHDLVLFGNSSAILNFRIYDGDLKLGSFTTPNTTIYNNGNAFFGGNVSIGTSSPSPGVKLEVNGDINAGSSAGTNTGYGTRLNILGNSLNGDPLWISRYNNGNENSELRVNIGDDRQAGDMFVVGSHYWSDGAWYPYFAVQSSGNVGIGTTSPDAKLAVNGQVHAQEVKVSATVPGPDYVFEKGYIMPTLDSIKNYIDKNRHLPEIPSAKEMEKDGIRLGEMNILLLKKIEELTLYVIELKKEIGAQQKEIEKLKK